MRFNISINLIRALLLLIFSEVVSAPFVTVDADSSFTTIIQQNHHKNHKLLFSHILLGKAEEGEASEEEADKFPGVEMADFSKLTFWLVKIHSPDFCAFSFAQYFDPAPPLFKLFCVFLI